MKRAILAVGIATAIFATAVAVAPAAHKVKETTYYAADLRPIAGASYEQDASGTANLELDGNRLTVEITAVNLKANALHPQHIHGFGKGTGKKQDATCPTIAQDDDGDGFVSVPEGADTYGPILLPLEPFPTADSAGTVTFSKTFKVKRGQLTPLVNREIVLHGGDVNGTYDPSLPVLCGSIAPAPQG